MHMQHALSGMWDLNRLVNNPRRNLSDPIEPPRMANSASAAVAESRKARKYGKTV